MFFAPVSGFRSNDARIGVSVKLTKRDASVAITITPANGPTSIPTTEDKVAIGTKTTTFVSALAETALMTSAVPSAADSAGDLPRFSQTKMFSITMTELVTRIPEEQPIATSVIMLNV